MAEIKDYRSPAGEKGVEIKEWEPGFRERKIGALRLILDRNPRGLSCEEVRVEIDTPAGIADTTPAEKAEFYLPLAALEEGLKKLSNCQY